MPGSHVVGGHRNLCGDHAHLPAQMAHSPSAGPRVSTKKPARGGLWNLVVNSHAVHGYGKFSLAEATCCFSRRSDFDAPV